MANLSAWQTCLQGKPVCRANLSAWQTCLHGNHVCLNCTCLPVCASSLLSACLGNFFLSVCQGPSFCQSNFPSISVHLFSVFLSVCLTNLLSVCLSFCLAILFSAYICLSVCVPGKPFLCLYVCLSVCLSVCLPGNPFLCPYVCLSAWQSFSLPICLSVCLSAWHPFVCADRCHVLKHVLIPFSQHGSDCQAGELDRIRGAPLYLSY
jgi:hypothetical protein